MSDFIKVKNINGTSNNFDEFDVSKTFLVRAN